MTTDNVPSWPEHDGSRFGRLRDNTARVICTWALDHIATPWYAKMIAGSIRFGLTAARDEEVSQRVFKLTDNAPELVARLRRIADEPGKGPVQRLTKDAADALESLHAEVETMRSTIDRQTNAYNSVAARLADRDAQIAEALAWTVEQGAPTAYPVEPFTFNKGVTAAATDLHAILSRSPRGAADRLKAEALEEAAEHLAGMMRGFPQDGRHTRAGWAVEMLKSLAGRARAEGEPTAAGDRS